MSARYYIYFLIHGLYCGLPSLIFSSGFFYCDNLQKPPDTFQQLVKFVFPFFVWFFFENESRSTSKNQKRTKGYCGRKIKSLQAIWYCICQACGFSVVKTRPNTVSRDIFEDQTIVLLVLARREYHTAVVALQIATVSLMPTPTTVQTEPRLARICRWTRVHSSERDNFSKFLPRGGKWI